MQTFIKDWKAHKSTRITLIGITAFLIVSCCCISNQLGSRQNATPTPSPSATAAPPTITPTPSPSPSFTPPPPTATATATPTHTATATTEPTPALDLVEAAVERIIDGDTIYVLIEGQSYSLRYIGIDCPETVHPDKSVEWMGPESTEANRKLVEGQIVFLEKDVSETDRYDRLLRYVWLQDGTLVNEALVALGYAAAVSYPPDVKYQERFRAAQSQAQAAGLGLWGPTPTPSPATLTPTATTPPPTRTPAAATPTAVPVVPATEPPPPTAAPQRNYLTAGVWWCPTSLEGAAYVGSVNSEVFHYRNCTSVGKIAAHNRICYESREAAVNYGKRPCQNCKP